MKALRENITNKFIRLILPLHFLELSNGLTKITIKKSNYFQISEVACLFTTFKQKFPNMKVNDRGRSSVQPLRKALIPVPYVAVSE